MKPFEFADCLNLKKLGYDFLGIDFRKKKNQEIVVLYPFKNEAAAKIFSKTDDDSDSFIIEINDDLKILSSQYSGLKIYIQEL